MKDDRGQMLLLPSMLWADCGHLADEVEALVSAGADGLHLELMDGTFVPNFGMGWRDIEWMCARSGLPCAVHMMVSEPGRYVRRVIEMGAQAIYVHPDADSHAARTLKVIAAAGIKAGLAMGPRLPLESIEPLLPLCDYVLAMTVNPGFGGQAWQNDVNPKIETLAALAHEGKNHFDLIIEGGCSPQKISWARALGAKGFVLGAPELFSYADYGKAMHVLRLAGER